MKIITPIRAKTRHELLLLAQKTQNKADVLEIWLDELTWLSGFADDLKKTCPKAQLLGVCKTPEEQGTFIKDQAKKRDILLHFLDNGGDWVDLDISKNELKTVKAIPSEKLWLSLHDFDRVPVNLEETWSLMQLFKPFGTKFALTPRTPVEYMNLLEFAEDKNKSSWSSPKKKVIFTTMGEKYGVLGRKELQEKDLSWGGFYAISEEHSTANGQMTLTKK